MNKKELLELINEVNDLIVTVEKTHRYSMSQIYGMYNRIFKVNENPQSCASCLIRKVEELKKWLSDANKKYAEMPAEEEDIIPIDNRKVWNYEEALNKEKTKNKRKAK